MKKLPDSPIKVLQLPSYFMPFGGEFCWDQCVALQRCGIEVSIIAHQMLPSKWAFDFKKYPLKQTIVKVECNIPVYHTFQRNIPKWTKLNLERWIVATFRRIEQFIKEHGKPDIIHAHSWHCAGCVCYLIKQKYHIPYVITEHSGKLNPQSNCLDTLLSDGWSKDLLFKAYLNSDAIIGVSDEVITGIRSFLQREVPMYSISNIVDGKFFHMPVCRTENQNFVFACANPFLPVKAYDVLFSAFDRLIQYNSNVCLRIAGGGFDRKKAKRAIALCKNRDKVEFLGNQTPEGVRKLLWQADAFVLPSRQESQSIATLEALCTGLPVVCTDVVPQKMVIPQVGYRVPSEDSDALASAMLKMMENKQQFDPLFISKYARQLSDAKTVAHQIVDVYKVILSH
jgi:glycosyltransferase involved in cell wall biosynthesis